MNSGTEEPPGPSAEARQLRVTFRRLLSATLLAGLSTAAALGIVELAYRFQWVDFYRAELQAYNPRGILSGAPDGPTLLALGDSFTAGTASYPNLLRALLPGWRIINGGLSGTAVVQANIVAPGRLRQFNPRICVYQIFVGNDLFDIRYPAASPSITPPRRLYWFLASRLRWLAFINYRLGQWRAGRTPVYAPFPVGSARPPEAFSPDRYDPRERLNLAAEPALIENHVRVAPPRSGDYHRLIRGLEDLRDRCRRSNCDLLVLVIPHAAQVASPYLDRMTKLGATFQAPDRMTEPDYPFLAGIRKALGSDPGVKIVDPLPALQAAERNGTPVYLANDGHLNPEGQKCMANLLVETLKAWPPAMP